MPIISTKLQALMLELLANQKVREGDRGLESGETSEVERVCLGRG